MLFYNAGFYLLAGIDSVVFGTGMLLGLSGLFQLFALIPGLAVGWRRMHDTGRPGWWMLMPFAWLAVMAPLVMAVGRDWAWKFDILARLGFAALGLVVIVWLVLPTQPGPNRYGPEPPA